MDPASVCGCERYSSGFTRIFHSRPMPRVLILCPGFVGDQQGQEHTGVLQKVWSVDLQPAALASR